MEKTAIGAYGNPKVKKPKVDSPTTLLTEGITADMKEDVRR